MTNTITKGLVALATGATLATSMTGCAYSARQNYFIEEGLLGKMENVDRMQEWEIPGSEGYLSKETEKTIYNILFHEYAYGENFSNGMARTLTMITVKGMTRTMGGNGEDQED